MHIDSYKFGEMIVDGKIHSNDLIIYPNGIKSNWFRKEGHKLYLEDIKDYLTAEINLLIVGTGSAGMLEVMKDVQDHCTKSKIALVSKPTAIAIKEYNASDSGHTIGAFHLTC